MLYILNRRTFARNIKNIVIDSALSLLLLASGLSSALPIFLTSTANATGTAIVITPDAHNSIHGGNTATSTADANGHHDVTLSFDYDISDLESDNSLTFGWRSGVGGPDHQLGIINGATGNPAPSEIGTKDALITDSGAYSSDLVIYFSNNGSGGSDDVTISNIKLTGVAAKPVLNTRTNETFDTVQDANDDPDTQNGDTIVLNSDITVSSQQSITKSVTINGNGYALNAAFAKTSSSNNAALGIMASNVTINNLVVNGLGSTGLSGIQAYEVTGTHINNSTIKKFASSFSYGLLVNGSEVTVDNLSTIGNFASVDVDQGEDVSTPTILTVDGISNHSDIISGIYVDDTTKDVHVVDSNNQYQAIHPGIHHNDRSYMIKPAPPTNLHRVSLEDSKIYACGSSAQRQAFEPTWTKSTSANVSYYEYSSFNKNHVPGIIEQNIGNVDHFDNSSHWVAPEDGTGYAFAVRAVFRLGSFDIKSDWAECGITYDSTAPVVPTAIYYEANSGDQINNGEFTNEKFFRILLDSSSDVTRYQLKYWNDIAGSPFHSPSSAWNPASLASAGHMSTLGVYTDGFTQGEGTHWASFSACDAAGNCSPYSSPMYVIYDKAAPDAPALVSPANNAVVNGSSITQSWSDASSDVDYYIYESYNDAGATSLRWHEEFNTTSKTATNVSEVSYWWRVKAVDYAGNESDWSSLWKISVDNTAPTVSIDAPSNGSTVNHAIDIRGTVTDAHPHHYWLQVKKNDTVIYSHTTNNSTDIINQLLRSVSGDGQYTATLAARDATGGTASSGNRSSDVVVSFTIDTVAPALTISGVIPNGDGTYIVNGTTDDPDSPVAIKQDGSTISPVVLSGNNWSVVTVILSPGDYTFTADSTDNAGNNANQQSFVFNIPEPEAEQPEGEALGVSTDNPSNGGSPVTNTSELAVVSQPDTRGGRGSSLPIRAYGGNNEDLSVAVESANDPRDDSKPDKGPQVMAAESTNDSNSGETNKDNQSCSKLLGLCWYYWIPIVAVVAIIIWGISKIFDKKSESGSI